MDTDPSTPGPGAAEVITCASCKACCCKLEVMLMSEDEIPQRYIEDDRWGGRILKRLDDGWCAALDRDTMLCTIYERRPTICRDFAVGESECIAERVQLNAQIVWRK
jgi:Fe-S-cluster containining protein